MTKTVSDIGEVTPDWLTDRLRACGAIDSERVVGVEHSASESFNAHHFQLKLRYSQAPELAPSTLFLKCTKADRLPSNDREVRFYSDIAPNLALDFVPRCFDAHFDADSGTYHVLMEDLSSSHRGLRFPLPPERRHTELMIDALARLHASWWDNPDLHSTFLPESPSETVARYTQEMTKEYEDLVELLGEILTQDRRRVFQDTFAAFPTLMVDRLSRSEHLTFVHGDAHVWNFMVPKNANDSTIYLIDWHTFDHYLQCNTGVSDLAYMMIHNWFPHHRRRLEVDILRLYLDRLTVYGITGYTWDMLWHDYRLAALNSLYIVAQWGGWAPAAMTIYLLLENTMTAFEDLDCQELL